MSSLDIIVRDNSTDYVSYHPPEQWAHWPAPGIGNPRDPSYHRTSLAGAYVTFSFTGTYVAYYSDVASDHGEFEVELDGHAVFKGNAYDPNLIQGQQLFSTDVDPGAHTLRVANLYEKVMGVQYFIYRFSQPGPPSSTLTDAEGRTPSLSHISSALSVGTGLSPSQPSPIMSPGPQNSHHAMRPEGHIPLVWGLLCGLLVLCLVVAIVFVARYRRSLHKHHAVASLSRDSVCDQQPPPYAHGETRDGSF